jgi:hypothetical protein
MGFPNEEPQRGESTTQCRLRPGNLLIGSGLQEGAPKGMLYLIEFADVRGSAYTGGW